MYVRVDQSRHQGAVTKINHLCGCGMVDGGANFFDLVAHDQHFARRDDAASFNFQQASGMKHDGTRRLRLRRKTAA